jgi:predicted nucleic acid-binding protein
LELGYSARTPTEYAKMARLRHLLVQLTFTDEIARRARVVQAMLAKTSQHRAAGVVDLLTAAAAEHHGAEVLHYDADFDHIAAVTDQPTSWIVPQGSVA